MTVDPSCPVPWDKMGQTEMDILKQEKDVLKQKKDFLSKEKDIPKQERMF